MPDIVLTTLNAKYIHASFGLRYLLANLGSQRERAIIIEFDINQRPLDIAEVLLARAPRIIGFGVYIWNVDETREVAAGPRDCPFPDHRVGMRGSAESRCRLLRMAERTTSKPI